MADAEPKRRGLSRWLGIAVVVIGAGVVATLIMSIILITRPQAALVKVTETVNPTTPPVTTTTTIITTTTPPAQQTTTTKATTKAPMTTKTTSRPGTTTQTTTRTLAPVVYSSSLIDESTPWPTNDPAISSLKNSYQSNLTSFLQIKYPGSSVQNVLISEVYIALARREPILAASAVKVTYNIQMPANVPSTATAVAAAISSGILSSGLNWNNSVVIQVSGPTVPPITTTTTTTTTTPPHLNWSPGFLDAGQMLRSGIDATVDPCQDFYQHACGKWNANNPPTPSHSISSTYGNLNRQILQNISNVLLNTPASAQGTWPLAVKTAALVHKTCVNSYNNPVASFPNGTAMLKGIKTVTNSGGWPLITQTFQFDFSVVEKLMADLSNHGVQNLLTSYVDVDWQNTNRYSLYVDQATLSMNRKFLIDPLFANIRTNYLNLIVKVATLLAKDSGVLGVGNVTQTSINNDALAILNYEIGIARKMTPVTERRVFASQFNTFNLTSLQNRWPFFSWPDYLSTLLTVGNTDYVYSIANSSQGIVISQTGYMDELHGSILSGGTIAQRTVVNYLVWRWIYANLQFLPGVYRFAFEDFHKSLHGLSAMPPSTEQCASMMVQYMPFATGYVYVNYFYNDAIRSDVSSMTSGILDSFTNMLTQVSWMDSQSINNALSKKNNVKQNIAYPSWLNTPGSLDSYDSLYIQTILNPSSTQNDLLLQTWYMLHAYSSNQYKLLSQNVNRNLWLASPALLNAWYQPSLNSITFAAAIMNPPFYRVDFPQAVKYGGLGVVIGHELSHGFDDEGSQFDSVGKLSNIYTDSANFGFENMAACVVSGYNQFCYPSDQLNLCVNGKNTQGENIADAAGVLAAYNAYQTWISLNSPELHIPGLENYTPNQVFFLSFAHILCGTSSPQSLVQQLVIDPHSPGRDRVMGALMNSDIFGVAYNCPRSTSVMLPAASKQCPVYRAFAMPPPMPTPTAAPAAMAPSQLAGWKQASQIILNGLDESVDPCQDFYHFSCNNWIKSHPLQPHQSRRSAFGEAQTRVYDKLMNDLHNLNLAANPKTLTAAYNFYESCLLASGSNTPYGAAILSAFTSDIHTQWPILTPQFSVPQGFLLWNAVAALESFYSIPTFFSSYVTVDYKQIKRNALFIDQGTLGLGSKQFYTNDQFASTLLQYTSSITTVATILASENNYTLNTQQFHKDAEDIVDFETQLANIMVDQADLTDYQAQFNEYNISMLSLQFPGIDWPVYLGQLLGLHVDTSSLEDRFVIPVPNYIAALNGLITRTAPRTIINYMGWRYFWDNLMFVGPNYRQAYLDVLKVRDGVSALPPSGHSCIGLLMGYMPFGVGRLYIQNYPNLAGIRTDIAFQTRRIIYSFQQMVKNLPWMDDNSKRLANRKAAGLIQNDLYPDWIMNDQQLDQFHSQYISSIVDSTGASFFQNYRNLRYGRVNDGFRHLTQPANRKSFLESPALVNAWYQPERNSITFPLGILQPPYYQLNFPQAFNYGGQGATAGHELSHGFDNSGVQFFTNGTLYNWMSSKSKQNFKQMAQCVVNQYSGYCYGPPINLCINGAVTQGENIADIAGIRAGYYAYQDYISYKGPEPPLPNLTNYTMNQIFFLSYAHGWCSTTSSKSLTNQLVLDVHSPAKWRVNGVLADMPEFAQAFNCPAKSPETKNQCTVW